MKRSDWSRHIPEFETTRCTQCYQTPFRVRIGGWVTRLIVQLGILHWLWNGKSALMLATEGGHTEIVKTLLDAGANVSIKIACCMYMLMNTLLHVHV